MAEQQKDENEEDEDDEDYVDAMDEESDDGEKEQTKQGEQQLRPRLSAQKRKAVDQAFKEMFGYPYGTSFAPLSNKRRKTKKEQILVEMFGPTAAARLLGTEVVTPSRTTKLVLPPLQQEKATTTQVKRFAGTDVTIKTATTAKDSKPSLSKKPAPKKGLDLVLDQLEGPSKISAVAKTSADWDKFKDDRGLEEELEKKAQGKDAYLVKKDFLDRVDHRRFENERKERDRERAAKQK